MSAGKGDTPRAVNGDLYRRNYDAIFRPVVAADYVRRTQYIDQIAATFTEDHLAIIDIIDIPKLRAAYKAAYPNWICDECGRLHGKRPEGNPYGATWHIGECGVCGTGGVEVTEPRDFGHLREGWDK